MTLKSFFSRLSAYVLVLVGIFAIIAYDASETNFSESSVTEYAQEFFLLLMVGISFFAYKKYRRFSTLHFSWGLLALAFLVREYNNFAHDYLFPYAWSTIVIALLLYLGFFLYRNFDRWKREFTSAANSYAFAILLVGMLILQVFSRLYGLPFMWEALMSDQYLHSIIRASEESIELLGYSILLIGTVEFYLLTKQRTAQVLVNKGQHGPMAPRSIFLQRC